MFFLFLYFPSDLIIMFHVISRFFIFSITQTLHYGYAFSLFFRIQVSQKVDTCPWSIFIQSYGIYFTVLLLQVTLDMLYTDSVSLLILILFS